MKPSSISTSAGISAAISSDSGISIEASRESTALMVKALIFSTSSVANEPLRIMTCAELIIGSASVKRILIHCSAESAR